VSETGREQSSTSLTVGRFPGHGSVVRRAPSGEIRAPITVPESSVRPPTGTVTFMLTDIEGSTAMWREQPQAMLAAVQRHREIVHDGIQRFGGFLPRDQGEGDSVFAAFDRPTHAVAGAISIQRALGSETWPTGTDVRIRIGLHSGEAEMREGNYYGSSVSRTARLRALAWGGQVLLSRATVSLVQDNLPAGASLTDLGPQSLKGFETQENVYQLLHPDIEREFPPLQARESAPNNLPVLLTTFVGRTEEMAVVKDLLSRSRLVTLTGTGGAGKTRLAIEAAKEMLGEYEDGVHLVDLATVMDHNLVLSSITHSMGIYEHPGQSTFDNLVQFLRDKQILLILDNFERVLDAAPQASDLLRLCPRLSVLVTSRASLRLSGEQEYSIPPLRLPDKDAATTFDEVLSVEAVRLFVERAQAASFSFKLTEENASIVASICHRLDGLPLAIELAAAHVKLLPLEMLSARLDSRLDALRGGARDLPARQQTLRNLIDWDYSTLSPGRQALFRRLAVFAGGFTLEAAMEVVDELEGVDIVEGLESLIDGSLLRHGEWGEGYRFWMLQTIRDYAADALESNAESAEAKERHARYFIELAVEAETHLRGANQVEWLDKLESEHDNLRAALHWTHEQEDPHSELVLVGAMSYFWSTRGHISEGLRWIRGVLDRSDGRNEHRAKVLSGAGLLARARGDYDEAEKLLSENLSLYEELGDDIGRATTIKDLANIEIDKGNSQGGGKLNEESLEIFRELGDNEGIAQVLNNLGVVAQALGDPELAIERYLESFDLLTDLGDKQGLARSLMNQGSAHRDAGDIEHSIELLKDSMVLWLELEDRWDASDCIEDLGAAYAELGLHKEATTLYGYADALRAEIGAVRPPFEYESYDKRVRRLREELGEDEFNEVWRKGAAMSLDEAADYALGVWGSTAPRG
jgi:predicted ATPase/class 3 adenylate cyclase